MNSKLTTKIKIDMKKTYKITLPKGANIDTVETNADNGVLEVTVGFEQKYVPKDGDVVYAQWEKGSRNYKWIFIYKKTETNPYSCCHFYVSLGIERDGKQISGLLFSDCSNAQELLRLATEAEKQRLFDALAMQGKRWNAEKKQIEDLPRWRAEESESYYYVDLSFNIRKTDDLRSYGDNNLYEAGNYFRTREAAEKVAEQIRDIFKNSKAE